MSRHYSKVVSPSLTIKDLTSKIPAMIKEVEAFKNPAKRLAKKSDTASQIALLSSSDYSYINGVNLLITATPI